MREANAVKECAHAVPAFGCESCINRERRATMIEAVKSTPRPTCPSCTRPNMYPYDWSPVTMTIDFVCDSGFDSEGAPRCSGELEVKVR